MSVLSFPLTQAAFFDLLPIAAATMDCPENAVASITGGGEVLRATLAPPLWRGRVQIAPRPHGEIAKLAALLDVLQRPGASFLAHDPRLKFPQADPEGSALGAAVVRIASVNADQRRLALKGLPAGYVLTRGDYLGFTHGSPARHALHRLVAASVSADGSGTTGEVEVTPPIRPGAAIDDAVTLVRPACKAVLLPGTLSTGTGQRLLTSNMSFDWVQTLR